MSFAESHPELAARMKAVGLVEDDLIEKFIRGSGSGGQKINKTSSCVFLQDPKSGLEVKVQRDRSRESNRFAARQELCAKLEEKAATQKEARQQRREKIRRQKRQPGKRAKARNVEKKRRHGQKKKDRGRINRHD